MIVNFVMSVMTLLCFVAALATALNNQAEGRQRVVGTVLWLGLGLLVGYYGVVL